ncbi:hypothetical protein XA68_10594 [Ophiocordyceps unilateralis]|uniref:Uncharacterized protein n=1 Tax=Ophiocordyceps unilateralis TaxID=268505 RepID=A0A2A9PHE7_OPHUN|nr:hypothetical protein XA68_10594 [Ophiocordyceps unilateralis]
MYSPKSTNLARAMSRNPSFSGTLCNPTLTAVGFGSSDLRPPSTIVSTSRLLARFGLGAPWGEPAAVSRRAKEHTSTTVESIVASLEELAGLGQSGDNMFRDIRLYGWRLPIHEHARADVRSYIFLFSAALRPSEMRLSPR